MKLQVNDEVEYLGMKATIVRLNLNDLNNYYSLSFPNYTIKRRRNDNGYEEYQIYNPITATIPKTKETMISFIKRGLIHD